MVVGVRNKLRQALGSLKDQASIIGKAMISGQDVFSELEIAVVRATAHDGNPADEKYVHEILFLVSSAPGSVPFLGRKISRRLAKTRDPAVALKTLLLVHRLMRGGDRNFEQQLRSARLSGDLVITASLQWLFSADSGDVPAAFLLAYVAFLDERMNWEINQAGKLEPFAPAPPDKSVETVFYRLPRCQTFLDRILDCLPPEISPGNRLTQAALWNILRESFQVYASFCEGVATLADCFFDFKTSARVSALAIFRRASAQTYQLADYFDECKKAMSISHATHLEFPAVGIISSDCVTTMEEFLTLAPNGSSCASILDSPRPPPPCKGRGLTLISSSSSSSSSSSISSTSSKLETKICTVWVKFDEEDVYRKPRHDLLVAEGGELEKQELLQSGGTTPPPWYYNNPFLSYPDVKPGNFLRG